MPLAKIQIKPGFNSQLTQTANESGWFSCNLVRWKNGLLEKLGGWSRLISTPCAGLIRAMHAWEDLSAVKNLLIGTDAGPQVIQNTTLTTLGIVGTVFTVDQTDFSVTNGTKIVTVTTTISVPTITVGDQFTIPMTLSVGRRILPANSTFTVASVATDGLSFTFLMASNATATDSHVKAVAYFTFGIAPVDLKHANVLLVNHGLTPGTLVTLTEGTNVTPVPGNPFTMTVNMPAGSSFLIQTVPDADNYTFLFDPTFGSNSLLFVSEYEGSTAQSDGTITSYGQVIRFAGIAPTPAPIDWFTDNLGQNGLISWTNSAVFVFDPSAVVLQIVNAGQTTSPQINSGMFTAMPQAQIIAFGSETTLGGGTQDPLLIRWSDAGDFATWTATVSNQAGSYRLSRGSAIIGGYQAPQTTLLWTDTDCWSMSYIGPPLIYGFNIIGTGCGLISAKARCSVGRNTFWQGQNSFWMFGDAGVQPLLCSVWDIVFNNIDLAHLTKCFAAPNSSFTEVSFWFPTVDGNGECDSYVKYNIAEGLWDYGGRVSGNDMPLYRTTWEDNSIFGPPMAGDENMRIQQHELGNDNDTVAMSGVFAETGYSDIKDGTDIMMVDQLIPDFKWYGDNAENGAVNVIIRAVNYANGKSYSVGPYSTTPTTQFVSIRVRARQLAMRLEWAPILGFASRLGAVIFRVKATGSRP